MLIGRIETDVYLQKEIQVNRRAEYEEKGRREEE